jgi:hypothetical protein
LDKRRNAEGGCQYYPRLSPSRISC